MARDAKQLMLDRETPETLRFALDGLDDLVPTSPQWVTKIVAAREDFLAELRTLEGASPKQGSLF